MAFYDGRAKTLDFYREKATSPEARAKRRATLAAQKQLDLRSDFLDAKHWMDLAREADLALPHWGTPCTPAAMGPLCPSMMIWM